MAFLFHTRLRQRHVWRTVVFGIFLDVFFLSFIGVHFNTFFSLYDANWKYQVQPPSISDGVAIYIFLCFHQQVAGVLLSIWTT